MFPLRYADLGPDTTFQANAADKGWAELVQPYIKSTQLYQCPSESNGPVTTNNVGYTDYWYNGKLQGVSDAEVEYVSLCILAGDGNTNNSSYVAGDDGNTTANELAAFPGAQRHLDGANLAFVDGHVKWFKGDTVTTSSKVFDDDQDATNKAIRVSFTP